MINLLMVDSDESTIKEVKQYFSSISSINISKVCMDGKEACDELTNNTNGYDVVLLNPVLPSIDGLGILKTMEEQNINTKVIIYADYNNPNMIKSLYQYDISFYLLKSINKDILRERIEDAVEINYQKYEFMDNSINRKISKLLHDLGMPSHIKGYQYIRDAIILIHDDPKHFSRITKQLYPTIAQKYDTTSSRVERAIRHAIEVSWCRGDYDLMDEIFGHSVDFDRAKPTNSEFLATLADKISLDENKYKLRYYN